MFTTKVREMREVYFKFVPDDAVLNNDPTELAKNNWLKYNNIHDKNTHFISYLMKKHFAGQDEIKYNQYKKPIIDNGFFNISHDKKLCVGVFDRDHDIGIDVMNINRRFHNVGIYKKIFNDDESKDIFQFSRKEAYTKMIGKGILNTKLLDIRIIDGAIYYKGKLEPYNVFETIFNDYFICIVGKFNPTAEFTFKEFEIPS